MSKLIVIIGATGGQGGSVAQEFLADPQFKVRGVTRNSSGERAVELAKKGVEMVEADIGDEASLERAFSGAHVIFAVTDYYETFFKSGKDAAMAKETEMGCNLARAAARIPTLKQYIWSTLPHTSKLSGGEAIVPHFEGKAKVDEYIRQELPALFEKTTFCIFAIFANNMVTYPIFRPLWIEAAQKYIQIWPAPPNAPYASLGDHTKNTGVFVHAIATSPQQEVGTYLRCAVDDLTLESALAIWGKASGLTPNPASTVVISVSIEQYVTLWGEMGQEQASQWIFFKHLAEAGITTLPTLKEGLDLLDDAHRSKLVSTEESWKGMDWSSHRVASSKTSHI
ncbi:NmrA-like family-domain-containing protein [Whalleya microplaca]|nr:NmrA-like family-domain-containing protein [Whalleya microplaca]